MFPLAKGGTIGKIVSYALAWDFLSFNIFMLFYVDLCFAHRYISVYYVCVCLVPVRLQEMARLW